MSNPYRRRKAREVMTNVERAIDRFEQKQRSRTEGFVYFIECAGFVKVGHSLEPQRRVRSIQVLNPIDCVLLGTIAGGSELEFRLHDRLNEFHHRGEWYRMTAEVRAAIADLCEPPTSSV